MVRVTKDLTSKTTIVDNDQFAISDSADLNDAWDAESGKLKRLSWSNLKGALFNAFDYLTFNTSPTGVPTTEGTLSWNNADWTADLILKGWNVTLQIGQEMVKRVVNKEWTDFTEAGYQAVKILGATGQRLSVDLAQANSDANSGNTLWLVTEDIVNNQEGFITFSGEVRDINTTGSLQSETWADWDTLYLSPTTAGALTNIEPSAPNHSVIVWFVEYAHISNGKIFVKVDNGYELWQLHNVAITSPSNEDILNYNSSTQLWENVENPVGLPFTATAREDIDITDIIYIDSDWQAQISNGISYWLIWARNTSAREIITLTDESFILVTSSSNVMYARAYTVTNWVITTWAEVTLTGMQIFPEGCRMSDNSFVLAWTNAVQTQVNFAYGTVSGNTITMWTVNTFTPPWTASANAMSLCEIDTNKFATHFGTAWLTRTQVWTISWTTISFWAYSSNSSSQFYSSICKIGTNKVLISGRSSSNNANTIIQVQTISGTTISTNTVVWLNNFSQWQMIGTRLVRVSDDLAILNVINSSNETFLQFITISWTVPALTGAKLIDSWNIVWVENSLIVLSKTSSLYYYENNNQFNLVGSYTSWIAISPWNDQWMRSWWAVIKWKVLINNTGNMWLSDIAFNKFIAASTVTATNDVLIKWDYVDGFTWLIPWLTYYSNNNWVSISQWTWEKEIGVAALTDTILLK